LVGARVFGERKVNETTHFKMSSHTRMCNQWRGVDKKVPPEPLRRRPVTEETHGGTVSTLHVNLPMSNKNASARVGWVSVSKVGGKSDSLLGTLNASTNSSARTVMDTDLTAEQEAEARRIYDALKHSADAELMALARLLATKADGDIFGANEFQVREVVHKIGARAIQTALQGRKKGATTAPAAPAPAAAERPSSKDNKAKRSKAL
jgi:hypothetical protein